MLELRKTLTRFMERMETSITKILTSSLPSSLIFVKTSISGMMEGHVPIFAKSSSRLPRKLKSRLFSG